MEAKKAKLEVGPTINDLPNEILLKIFAFLPQSEHYAVGLVSKRFQALIDNTKWCKETPALVINEENVRVVKEAIEIKNKKFCFKRIKIDQVYNIGDLEYILKSIGQQIEYLSMEKTAAFHLLKENIINLKSLEIHFDDDLENRSNDGSFHLQFFPLLQELSIIYNEILDSTTNKLLDQLKSPTNISKLKHFKVECWNDLEDCIMDCLLHYASKLESLELRYCNSKDVSNIDKWKMSFSSMKNLKKLCLYEYFTPRSLNVIFSMLPKETLLEHLELGVESDSVFNEIFPLILNKWMDTLQYLELSNFKKLTDVDAMEFGKLHKLRVLKLIDCRKITKMAFLEGIAKEQNMIIDELHLEDIPKLDDLGFSVMVSRFPNLRVLTLISLRRAITNTSLASIWRFSTRLRSLTIDCRNITDEGLIAFGNESYSINRLRLLVELILNNCFSLTDRSLIEALKLPALRSVHLGFCRKITLKGIESLMKSCPLLECLRIPSTVFNNDNALFVIGNGLKRLRQLYINDCGNLTKELRDHLKDVFRELQDSPTTTTFSTDCELKF